MARLKVPIIPGDTVYFMLYDKIHAAVVKKVKCTIGKTSTNELWTDFTYEVTEDSVPSHITNYWSTVYPTKEALLKALS